MGFLRFIRKYSYPFKDKTRNRAYALQHLQCRGFSKDGVLRGNDEVHPVLIIGAGPVGLVLSILLTKLGINCTVLERNKEFSKHPQAHFINNRSMEIFRKIDGLVEEIQRSQPSVDLWRKFIYCTSLSGSILGSVDHIQPQDLELVVSPVSVAHFSQYKLIMLLLKQLENLGFQMCVPESLEGNEQSREKKIMMGHECVSIDASNDFVTITASSIIKGKCVEQKIHCNILIGTDGAGSTVRKLVGIEMRGEKDLQKLVSVHFFSRDLGQFLLKENPGMLFFIFNTEAIGVLVAHDLRQGEFVLQIPFYPPQQTIEDFSPKACEKLISKLVGREFGDVDVIDIKPWVMHAEVAERFICSGNRIVLAGDAAHRFPPAGGFGMNTGIQDAHNLAWKIASVFRGIAPTSMLNTYENERKPIALFNTRLSLENYKAAMSVPAALGLDPTVANTVHKIIVNGIGSFLPSGLQKVALDGIFGIGRAQLSEIILNESNPLGSSRLAKLRHIFQEGKSLQLQFPAEDLGFRYLQGALLPESYDVESPPEVLTWRRRDYTPSAQPGSRLPHMFVRANPLSEETVSTLDLVSGDKVEFILIIAPVEKGKLSQLNYCTVPVMDAPPPKPENEDYLEPFRVSVDQILNRVNKLEKQVTEVEQFYESNDNVQSNNSKGGSLVKDKGREKHVTSTKKPLQDASHAESAAAKRMQELMRQFSTILRQITQHKWAWPFMDPVDVEGLGLHDYYKVIDKPMDFSTIKSKMEAKDGKGYNNVREIYADVRLIFKNAMKYNNEKHDVHVMAKTLLEKFEEKWLQLLPKVAEEEKRQLEEEAQAQLDIQLAQETTYANKAKDISAELYEVEMHLKSLKETVIKKCRKLSTQEKKMLGAALGKLSTENLYRALDIVAETNPIFQPSTNEVDLDLDAQSDYTLWRLKAFVKDALEEQEKVGGVAGVNPNDNPDDKKSKRRRDSGDSSGKTNPKRKKLSTL